MREIGGEFGDVMFLLKTLGLRPRAETVAEPEAEPFVDSRGGERRAMFQDAVLVLEDYHKLRAVITNLSESGARVEYATRVDLPFRLRLIASGLKRDCWVRVAWQHEGAAGLEFEHEE